MQANLRIKVRSAIQAAAIGGICLTQAANAAALVVESVYFDISFSSPLHQVGSRPTTNAGPETPSLITFGSPEVVSGLGALTNQPLVLNTAGNSSPLFYDQFKLVIGRQQSTYHVSFDILTVGMIGSTNSFGIFLDIPDAAQLGFYPSGTLYPPCWPGPSPLPKFVDGSLMHIDISLDLANNRSVTLVDGVVVGDGQAIGNKAPGDLRSVRFSLGGSGSATIGIDNIRVTNGFVVPECGIPVLLMLSSGVGLTYRGRCRCAPTHRA